MSPCAPQGSNTTAGTGAKSPDFLKVLTKPFTKGVVQLDKEVDKDDI